MRKQTLALAAVLVILAGLGAYRFGAHRLFRKTPEPRVVPVAGESRVLPVAPAQPAFVRGSLESTTRSLQVLGRTRKYLELVPRGRATGALPLVLVLHGDGGDASGFHAAFPFEAASGDGAVLAYPDGLGHTWDLETTDRNPDVALLAAVVDDVAGRTPIDRDRVYAVGYSSGGFLANVTACQRPGLLRAISSSAGGAPYNQLESWPNGYPRCPGQKPVATIALHGRRDFGVSFDSGKFTAMYWAYVNGCNEGEVETTGYPECHAYTGCNPGRPVVFCDIASLGHWVWDRGAVASWTFFGKL